MRIDNLIAQVCSFLAHDVVNAPNWGSGLRKFLPKEKIDREKLAREMLQTFDAHVKPKGRPIPPPLNTGRRTLS